MLYALLPFKYCLLALETWPTVGVVELRRVALLLLSLFPLGLVFEEVPADLIQLSGSDAMCMFSGNYSSASRGAYIMTCCSALKTYVLLVSILLLSRSGEPQRNQFVRLLAIHL
jgi:hypothetical protein